LNNLSLNKIISADIVRRINEKDHFADINRFITDNIISAKIDRLISDKDHSH
jgi:hypothetical protein